MTRRSEKVSFEGTDGNTLIGRLHQPVGEPQGVALFAHCFTCSKDLNAARRITEALASRGIATLRFDFTGLGESDGDFADTTFSSNVGDLVAAGRWLAENVAPPTLLVGHSLGGAAVYCAAEQLDSVRAVASISAPSDPTHLEALFDNDTETIRAKGEAVVQLAGRPFKVKEAFLDDLRTHRLTDRLPKLRKAVLILHSPQDRTVGIENARELFVAAHHPKSFISLDGADHLLSRGDDAAYAGEVIASWARRYALDVPIPSKAEHRDDVETTTAGQAFATEIVAHGMHRLRSDEPIDVGGADTGPTPFELVSAGLGACTGMTLRMYANRKGIALDEVRVHLRHDKVRTAAGMQDRIVREVAIQGEMTDDQRARMLEIADRCPVHRALTKGMQVETVGIEGH